METLWHDLAFGLRMLRKSPGFAGVAVLMLALGIGPNTAILTLVNAFALRPLPVPNASSIVRIGEEPSRGARRLFSYREYLDYRDRNQTLTGLVAFNKVTVPLGDALPSALRGDGSMPVSGHPYAFGLIVSGNYFEVLGGHAAMGRELLPDDDQVPDGHPVAVLSHSFWRRRMASDPAIVGKVLKLDGRPFTVVGVMGPAFTGLEAQVPDFWAPLMMRDALVPGWLKRVWHDDRSARTLVLFGRLRPGVSPGQAQTDLRLIEGQLVASHRDVSRPAGPVNVTSGSTLVNLASIRPVMIPILLAVGLVLLVACANVANLLLSRSTARQREIAIRLALGCSRGRLLRQLMTESLLLAVFAGLVSLLLSVWTLDALYPAVVSALPLPPGYMDSFIFDTRPDARVFLLTFLLSLATGVLFGLAPAWQASSVDLTAALKGETLTPGIRTRRMALPNLLAVAQIAICLTLLIAAALLTRSLWKLQAIDMGLSIRGVSSIAVGHANGEIGPQQEAILRNELRRRLVEGDAVLAAGEAMREPLTGSAPRIALGLPGQEPEPGRENFLTNYNFVSPDYFHTLGLKIVRGRCFTQEEADSDAPIALVSESTARHLWAGEEPLGKRIVVGTTSPSSGKETQRAREREVVGIVQDARSSWVWKLDENFLYLPLSAKKPQPAYLFARMKTPGQQTVLGDIARREAAALDKDAQVVVRNLEESFDFQMAPFRASALLGSALGALALVMASVGLYAVVAYLVSQRTREFGIRLALGAQRNDLLRLVLRTGMRLVVMGIVIGSGGAALVSYLLTSALIELSPLDPAAYVGASLLVWGITLLACSIPARRATRVDPLVALRYE